MLRLAAVTLVAVGCSFSPPDVDLPDGSGADAPDPADAPPDVLIDCGQAPAPRDDFGAGGEPCDGWSGRIMTASMVSETDGRLVVLPDRNASTAVGGCITSERVPLASSRMFVDVESPRLDSTFVLFKVHPDSGVTSHIQQQGSMIWASKASITITGSYRSYDPVQDRWWQIRHDGAATLFETSPDGTTWTAFASDATAPQPTNAYVEISAGTWMNENAPQPVFFDSVNVCPP